MTIDMHLTLPTGIVEYARRVSPLPFLAAQIVINIVHP
jgi:hypothetical protein